MTPPPLRAPARRVDNGDTMALGGVEGVGVRLRFGEPGRPVTANGVSLNGENASRTRESRCR